MMRRYYSLPDIPDAGLLTRYLDTLGVIVPLARTNLITCPSFETNTTGWTVVGAGASLNRVATQQYHGAYSLEAIAAAAGAIASFSISLTSGTTYAYSVKFKSLVAGRQHKISIATSGGVDLAAYSFTSTARWQWVWVVYTATSTATHQLNVAWPTASVADTFYIDGAQLEALSDGHNVPTTYIDGDQVGLVPNQFPIPYGWNGTPHASTSYRIGQTRAGGRIVRLKDLGFLLSAIIGLGMAPPQHQALTFAQLDGGQYENTLKPPRTFSLAGRVAAMTPNSADTTVSQLSRLFDRDLVAQRQPLVLTTQAQDCGVECGERVNIPALYSGGLEGNVVELPSQQQPMTFTQYIPFVVGHDQGAALDVQDTIDSAQRIVSRTPGGDWNVLSTGLSVGAEVRAIVVGLNGLVYVGGNFTSAGATSADFIASYDPQTSTWAVLASATALNGVVEALAVGADGRIYVGGAFTNANGIAAADFIAVWDPSAGTWAALSTGMNNTVFALAWSGPILYAGGDFTTAGGGAAARVAGWDGSAWSALGTGASASVTALAAVPGGGVYIGGNFTNGGGVAAADFIGKWDGNAWSALSTGMNAQVDSLAVSLGGLLYAGGVFTTAGPITAGGLAVWNGIGWQQIGSGFSSPGSATAYGLVVRPDGALLIASNANVIDPGNAGVVFMWNGSAFVDLGMTGPGESKAIALAPDGSIYAGIAGSSTIVSGLTTLSNDGTAYAYPVIRISGPSTGTSRIFSLVNETTGRAIYFDYTIIAGEVAILTLDPKNTTFVSSFRGNILNTILPGSMLTPWEVQPGSNVIGFLADSSTVTAVMRWQVGYNNLNDALYQAVAP